jgi:hypothetical protein
MHMVLENFEGNLVWTLVDPPHGVNVISTKWVLRNKHGEDGEVVRNKARLEAIRILLDLATSKGFELYQMDVKCVFLNGVIQEGVFVNQTPGFEDPKYSSRVYKLSKALYS